MKVEVNGIKLEKTENPFKCLKVNFFRKGRIWGPNTICFYGRLVLNYRIFNRVLFMFSKLSWFFSFIIQIM